MKKIVMNIAFIFTVFITVVYGSKPHEKVKLKDVQVLTLKANRMTTGRREPPVPQLNCLSNCQCLLPQTVQCTNRGWDGSSVQWECRADLEEGYRFGELSVTCEGYDYTHDDYILAGSCGLEYTLVGSGKASKYGGSKTDYGWNQDVWGKSRKSGFSMQNLIALGAFALIIYALYKTCISGPYNQYTQESTTDGDVPPDDRQYPNMGWNIPGMGTNRGYTGRDYPGTGPGCGMPGTGRRRGGGGGGFWTGLATGGLMGYMFGNRGTGAGQQYYSAPRAAPSAGFFGGSEPSFGSSSSTSTRSSTGFADTRRR